MYYNTVLICWSMKVGLVSREHWHEKVGCKTRPSLWWGDYTPLIPDVPPPRKNRVLPPLPVNSVDELCDERVLQELEELKWNHTTRPLSDCLQGRLTETNIMMFMKFGPAEDLCWSMVRQHTYCYSTTHCDCWCRGWCWQVIRNHNWPQH